PKDGRIRNIEVFIQAHKTSSIETKGITSLNALAEYGVTVDDAQQTIQLSTAWLYNEEEGAYKNESAGLTLKTTLKNVRVAMTSKNGNDVLLDAEAAAIIGAALQSENLDSFDKVLAHHEELAEQISKKSSGEGSYSNLYAGDGDDILFNNAANSVLLGDGDDATKSSIDASLGRNGQLIKEYIEANRTDAEKLTNIAKDLQAKEQDIERDSDGADIVHGGAGSEIIYGGGKADLLDGGAGNDILIGGSGDDVLLGGDGDDFLFGGSGNDFLDGGEGKDNIFGGSGNDLIVYHASDYLIDGGEGIDVLLARDTDPTLAEMTSTGADHKGAQVNGVEVLIKGADALDISSMDDLAAKLGVHIEGGKMTLDKGWNLKPGTGEDGKNAEFEKGDFTLETNLDITDSNSSAEAEQAAFTLSNSQG
ncbi:MAG: hypothetical protein K2N62_10025, partial [Desulfovibrio sp.]|nr:hypothetical protein [Desulfovibrio sp.]